MADDDVESLNRDIRRVRAGLRQAGLPQKLLDYIRTRALLSGRRTTGQFVSNRQRRWTLNPADPQFGTEVGCKRIYLRLLAMLLEFEHAPLPDPQAREILERHLGKPLAPGTYRDALTMAPLDYAVLRDEVENPVVGRSHFHIGHEDPTAVPKHTPSNVSWREERSNLIQGNLTLPQARTWVVEVIARYFDLGEVRIEPQEGPKGR